MASFMMMACTASAQDATITLNPDQANAFIPKEIYGQFSEHLGRCIYGGIWVGKNSPIPNIEGYRKDVFEALKDLEVPVMRWPGGCFADEYHWMDGIGPLEERPGLVNSNWGGTNEDNSFGTHEFLNLCELLGCDAYISGNVGSGTVEEMQEWVEYMTSDGGGSLAQLRRKNGREKPWKVKYFGVGNECWGCGGQMEVDYYANLYRRYNQFVHNYSGNQMKRIASGGISNDYNWSDVLMRKVGDRMDGFSLHYYAVDNWDHKGSATQFDNNDYYHILNLSLNVEQCIKDQIAIMDKYDPEKKVGLYVDEWGTWFDVEPGCNPGWLFQQNTMRDAIVASTSLDIFHRYTDRIRMANVAQVVNVLQAMILTNEHNPSDPCVLTPTYYVYKMYKPHMDATLIPGELSCAKVETGGKYDIPEVSFTASRDSQGVMHLSISNIDAEKEHTVAVNIGGDKVKTVAGEILASKHIQDYNDFGKEIIRPAIFKGAKVKNGQLLVTLPAHSVVTLEVK